MTTLREELKGRIERLEKSYEFCLAYAAQGLPSDAGSRSGGELRDHLDGSVDALFGLGALFRKLIDEENREPAGDLHAFIDILEQDAEASRIAIELVRAQEAISSQLVDNLNASIHLRALLTDLFLIDEILKVLGEEGTARYAPEPPEEDG